MATLNLHTGNLYTGQAVMTHEVVFDRNTRLTSIRGYPNGSTTATVQAVVWRVSDQTLVATGSTVQVDDAASTLDVVLSAGTAYRIGLQFTGSLEGIHARFDAPTLPHAHSAGSIGATVGRYYHGTTVGAFPSNQNPNTQEVYLTFGVEVANQPPNAPTLSAPAGGAVVDRGSTQRFDWDFNDPDPGDSQSQYELRYRVTGTTAWTTVTGVTPNTYRDVDGGTFSAADYEWQVRTYDAQGEVGPWSSSEFFTAATPPPGPTITNPTNGATVGLSSVEVTWSYPSQEAYRLQVQDGAGNTLTDTGQVNSTTARSYVVDLPTNNVTRTVRLQVLDGGLWSAWVAVTFEVSYTPPPSPVVSLLPDTDDGALVVTITNPSSGAGEPSTSYNNIYVDDGAGEERRAVEVPTNSSWTYWLPVSGRDYAGNIRVVAVGDNGTTSSS